MNLYANMVKYCIYKYTNRINRKGYVGKTPTHRFKNRKKEHKNPKKSPNMLITKAIVLHGIENFDIEIMIDNVSKDVDENYYIERENTRVPHGYNQRRGEGSGSVHYNQQHKKWRVVGPEPERKFVGLYFTKKKANEALDLFRRTGERMASDIKTRKRGTGTIRVTPYGRFQARIRWKGKRKCKNFDTEDECEAFFIQIKNRFNV